MEMIGRVCTIFPGHTLEACNNMTRRQIRTLFYESFRQEAREKLKMISVLRLAQSTSQEAKQAIYNIEFQANPPVEEEEPQMTKDHIRKLKSLVFGG